MQLDNSAEESANGHRRSKTKTIREWVDDRHPDFDGSRQHVLVNGIKYEGSLLDLPVGILDRIKVVPKDLECKDVGPLKAVD